MHSLFHLTHNHIRKSNRSKENLVAFDPKQCTALQSFMLVMGELNKGGDFFQYKGRLKNFLPQLKLSTE